MGFRFRVSGFAFAMAVFLAAPCAPSLPAQDLLDGEFKIDFPYPLLGRTTFPTVQELAKLAAEPRPQVALLFPIYPVERGDDRNDYYAPAWSPDGQGLSLLRADLKKRTSKIVLLPSVCERKAVTLLESADSYDYMLSWAWQGDADPGAVKGCVPFVFCSTVGRDENLDIYLGAVERGGELKKPVRLTTGKVLRRYPSLYQRADGARLLFCDDAVVKQLDLPADLSALLSSNQAGDPTGDASAGLGKPLTLGYGNYPAWAPDGAAVVYAKQKGEEAGHTIYDLYLRGREGMERPLVAEPGLRVRTPAWSPDGKQVAVYAAKGEGGWSLYAVQPRAVAIVPREIRGNVATEESFDYVGPAWLGSGRGLLCFARGTQAGGHYALCWKLLAGTSDGEIEYPGELTTANDLAISPAKGAIEAAFTATRRMTQDVYVMIATEPGE